jgi:hypothetical protein
MEVAEQSKTAGVEPFHAPAGVLAAFLLKLAKHLALIGCFMIIGRASGRFAPSEIGIFLTVGAAAVLHSIGRVLESRLPHPLHLPRLGP